MTEIRREDVQLEVCVDSISGARQAWAAGADRIELCAQLELGGVTPSVGLLESVLEEKPGHGDVRVLVRPRGGDFVYDADETRQMGRDLVYLAKRPVGGVVIGALDAEGNVDSRAMRAILSETAHPVTFHRAIDVARDPNHAFDALLALRRQHPHLSRVLTSGQSSDPTEAIPLLTRFVSRGEGELAVLIGGGLREGSLRDLARSTGAREFHFSASRARSPSGADASSPTSPRILCPRRLRAYLDEWE